MRKLVIPAVVLAAAICATAVWSQGGRRAWSAGGRPARMGGPAMACPAVAVMVPPIGMFEHETEALGLTDDQLTQIEDAVSKAETTVQPLMQNAADATKALRDALLASEYDSGTVADLAAAAEQAEAAVVTARLDEWTELRSILTADQVVKLKEIMSRRPGPPGPPPPGAPIPPPPAPEE